MGKQTKAIIHGFALSVSHAVRHCRRRQPQKENSVVETQMFNSAAAFTAYGFLVGQRSSVGKVRAFCWR